MIAQNEFDMVFDCQKTFKNIMNAMARPGVIFSIQESAYKLKSGEKTALAIGLTLLDNRCRYYVLDDSDLAEIIKEQTIAVESEANEADFVFVPYQENGEESNLLACGKVGTLGQPHKSAMFFVELPCFDGAEKLLLEGPGIDGSREIKLPKEGMKWMKVRLEQQYEFPCGVDILFYTSKGDIMGIPRTVQTGGNQIWDM